MKYKLLRFSLLCILTMLCGGSVWADYYEKVTSTDELVTGDYLIVYEDESVAFNGGLETLDAAKNNISVTIADNKISSSSTVNAAVFTIDMSAKTIKSASGKYIGISSYGNGLKTFDTGDAHDFITLNSDGSANIGKNFTSKDAAVTMNLRFNSSTNDKRFRYYKDSSQKAIHLYKKVIDASDTRTSITCSFAESSYITTLGSAFTAPTLTIDPDTYDGTITYASSNEEVATVDTNGSITLVGVGNTTITATAPATDNYLEGSATYTLTVRGVIEDGIFNFGNYQDYGSGLSFYGASVKEATWTAGNITMTAAGRSAWQESDGSYRLYGVSGNNAAGSITFTALTGKIIKQITFTGSNTDMNVSVGTLTEGTWTGYANSVTFTRNTDNAIINTITVTYEEASATAPQAPTFDPAAGTYYGIQQVTVSSATEGATIKVKQSEDGEFETKTSEVTITESKTIWAYAEKDGEKSETVSATYVIGTTETSIAPIITAAEAAGKEGKPVKYTYTPTPINVEYVNGKIAYLHDGTNGIMARSSSNFTWTTGSTIKGYLTGNAELYNGTPSIYVSAIEDETTGSYEPAPTTIEVGQIADNVNKYIKIEGATFVGADSQNNKNLTFKVNDTEFIAYNKFTLDTSNLVADKAYDLVGFGVKFVSGSNAPVYEIYPTAISEKEEETGFRDIKIDLTQHTGLLTGSNVYITVAEDGTIGTTDDPTKAAATIKGNAHSSYGSSNFTASVPVEGCVKITYATHDYGNDIIVTNSENEQVAKFNTNGAKWMDDHNNVVVAYYRTNSPTTLTFSNANYNPYFAVEAIAEENLPPEVTNYTVTYAKGDDVEGVVPTAVEIEAGNKAKAPANSTLYKEGYTLIGWESGNEVILPGQEFTPEEDMTLTAKFGTNEISLDDRTAAVTVTYALDGYNDNPKFNYQNGAAIIVTQATVGENSIDVKSATSGKFAHNGSGWTQVNAGTTVTVPACKDAVITIGGYATGYTLTVDGNAMTDNGDKTYSYTVPADATSAVIANAGTGNNYWNSLTITLPVVEQGGEEPAEKTIYSWDAGTETGGTITPGGTTRLTINGKSDYSSDTATLTLDNALHAGDIISVTGARDKNATGKATGFKAKFDKGGEVASATGTEFVNINAAVADSDEYGTEPNTCTFTVPEEAAGSKTITITRSHTGTNLYIYKLVITSTAEDDPNAVATPVITPATNTFTEAQEVSITCETDGATIYYTTDGADPTAESTQYSAPFTVSETTTVKAIAINGEYSSDIAESVITISSFAPGESNLEWSYDAENPIPDTGQDNGLYYAGYVNDTAGTNNGLHGVKLNSAGYAWFAKNPVAGKLTLTIGDRKASTAYAVNVYACTINGTSATKGELIGEISVDASPGTGNLDISAAVTGIWIERKTGSEGVISKIVFKEKIARTFTDFEIPYATLKVDGYTGADLPSGVTFNGTFHDGQHGYNGATLVVPTDGGAVKFTISGCQYGNTFPVKNSANETLTTLDQKSAGCYDAGGTLTYIYNGDATTLTFGPIGYLAYFKAEAVEVTEATITYKDQNGKVLGTKTLYEGDPIGDSPYTEADLTIEDGYKFRGWIYTNGVKVKATDLVDGSKSVLASVTAIEADPTVGSIQNYDLTSAIFYPEDHENFDVTNAAYYNNHGWNFAAGGSFSVKVAGKAQVVLTLCEYGNGTTITVTDADNNVINDAVPAKAESGKDGATTTVKYTGEATTLTFTFADQSYLHKVSVFNVNDFVEKDETSGYYIVPAGDAAGLVLAINSASSEANSKVFLPNGTYDLGTTALTTISGTNVSIIGESMEGVIIKNRPEIEGIGITATLLNTSTGLYMQDLTLDCEAPWGSGGANAERGVALQDKGTETILKNVYLKGRQDTYYCNNNNGQYYFEDGKIEGTVDYICGNGDAYFNKVTLFNTDHHNPSTGDCITAPNTPKQYGYIFNECTIDGVSAQDGKYSLGRPWAANTQVIYLNTTMKIQPLAAGWTDWSPANAVKQFAEYGSVDAKGDPVDTSNRKTTFNGVTNAPTLNETQAAAFALENVFAGWNPAQYTEQVKTTSAKLNGKTLTWAAVDGATMYAIVKNGSIIDLTDQTSYTIADEAQGAKGLGTATDDPTAAGDTYAVRAANGRGGFGEAVVANDATGIDNITTNATGINGTITEVYSMGGARLAAPQKGVNIVKVKANDGSVKTVKVVIK